MRHRNPGSAHSTAARVALTVAAVALALCAWEVVSARSGAADAQTAASAAQSDAAVAQAITALQLAELNDVIQPTATSQNDLLALDVRTRAAVVALASRIDPGAPAVAARLRVEAHVLDSQIHKLVAATAASDGQAVVDVNARVQQLASSMRTTVGRQEQLDADTTHSNLQSLRSSRPVLAGLLIAGLALAVAAALSVGRGRRPGRPATWRRAGDQPAARGRPS